MNLLAEAEAAGLLLLQDGDRLIVRGPRSAEALVRRILDRKAEVIAVLSNIDQPTGRVVEIPVNWRAEVQAWDEGRRLDFEERAAIMEHDGKLPRDVAELRAFLILRNAT